MNASAVRDRAPAGSWWAFVPVAMLGAMLIGLGVMCWIAVHDPGFSLEHDYYRKAVLYDREIEQKQHNAKLGWQFAIDTSRHGRDVELRASLFDRDHRPITGARVELEAFYNARASDRHTLPLSEVEPGRYVVTLPAARPGLWELRLAATRDAERYTDALRVDFPQDLR